MPEVIAEFLLVGLYGKLGLEGKTIDPHVAKKAEREYVVVFHVCTIRREGTGLMLPDKVRGGRIVAVWIDKVEENADASLVAAVDRGRLAAQLAVDVADGQRVFVFVVDGEEID